MRRRVTQTWQTVSGLITLADFLGFVGFWLYRGTLRRTMTVAIALGLLVFVGDQTEKQQDGIFSNINVDFDAANALTGTGLFFIFSFLGGLSLMMLSGSFSKSAMTLGEAKGFNLLEEMKKHRKETHRDKLWQRVYRYEQVRYSNDERRGELKTIGDNRQPLLEMCDPNRRHLLGESQRFHLEEIIRGLGRTEQGWSIGFEFGLQVPMGRSELFHRLRFDLTSLKDWYDGSPFHRTDAKLLEQYDAHEDLVAARKETHYSLLEKIAHIRLRAAQKLWFRMISRAVQVRTAQACARLDKKYAPFRFSIDHFLWPSRLADRMLRDQIGQEALDELIKTRRDLFHRVFHHDVDLAHKLLQKAIYPNFIAATRLRRRYDPEYVAGELANEWSEDIHCHNRALKDREKHLAKLCVRVRRNVREEQRKLREFLNTNPSYYPKEDPQYLRAIRIAYHTNHDGLRTRILRGDSLHDNRPSKWIEREPRSIEQVLRDVAGEVDYYTQKLLAVRLHHEIARVELEDYAFYLERILR